MDKQKNTFRKIIKPILIGLGIIIVSAVIAFVVIKLFFGSPATKVASNVTSTLSPADLIKKYSADYKSDGYTIDKTTSDSTISYKLSDLTYTIQINSINNVQFTKSDNSTSSDITNAIDKTKTFLTNNGFNKVSDQIYADQNQLLYDNQNNVCKIFDKIDATKKTSDYGLVCATKNQFISERNIIQTIVMLYPQTGAVADFKNVVRTIYTEGNKVLSLVSVNPQDKTKAPYTLIFASIDSKWAYIGNRVTPSVDVKDSFQISDSLKTAVNNPKYNGFLAKYIY